MPLRPWGCARGALLLVRNGQPYVGKTKGAREGGKNEIEPDCQHCVGAPGVGGPFRWTPLPEVCTDDVSD